MLKTTMKPAVVTSPTIAARRSRATVPLTEPDAFVPTK